MQNYKWYVVHTYANQEFKVREALLKNIEHAGLSDFFAEILVPTKQIKIKNKTGKGKRKIEKKLFLSYVLINCVLNDETQSLILATPYVTNFLKDNTNPIPLSKMEIDRILGIKSEDFKDDMHEEIPYEKDDIVEITDGPFKSFEGVVDKVSSEKGKLTVNVTIFGRLTPVELDFHQVKIVEDDKD